MPLDRIAVIRPVRHRWIRVGLACDLVVSMKLRVETLFFEQGLVSAFFNNFPFINDEYPISFLNS